MRDTRGFPHHTQKVVRNASSLTEVGRTQSKPEKTPSQATSGGFEMIKGARDGSIKQEGEKKTSWEKKERPSEEMVYGNPRRNNSELEIHCLQNKAKPYVRRNLHERKSPDRKRRKP